VPLIPLNFPVPATKDKVDRQQWLPCADALEHVTRQDNEAAARAYAEAAMAQSPDLRVMDVHARPCDSTEPPAGRQRAAWLRRRKQPALEQNPTG
jgi:hypothetical protein